MFNNSWMEIDKKKRSKNTKTPGRAAASAQGWQSGDLPNTQARGLKNEYPCSHAKEIKGVVVLWCCEFWE